MEDAIKYRHSSVGKARAFRRSPTGTEQILWSRLRGNQLGYYFRRQVPIGKYIVDFACRQRKLIVEVDGIQHTTMNGLENDNIRDGFLRKEGYRVVRISNADVSTNIDGVLEVIYDALHKRTQ